MRIAPLTVSREAAWALSPTVMLPLTVLASSTVAPAAMLTLPLTVSRSP